MTASDWTTAMISGGRSQWTSSPNGSSVIYSHDGRYAIILMTHEIRVYFIATRQCIRTILVDLQNVIQGQLDDKNNNQVILFKSTGEILVVNWKDRLNQPIISTTKFNENSSILSIISIDEEFIYAITGKYKNNSSNSPHARSVIKVDRKTKKIANVIFEVPNVIKYAISLNKKKIAFVIASNEVILYDMLSQVQEKIAFPYKTPITAIAVSNDSVIALGTSSGAIQILYGGMETSSIERPQRLLKWHIDSVKSLQFTPDNSYLLSGGLEKVLVFWQLDTDKTQFLPRLNGTIEKISIDSAKSDYYTLTLNIPNSSSIDHLEDQDETEMNNEILIISAVDLVSRLSVNGVRPNFAHGSIRNSLVKTNKRFHKLNDKFDKTKLRYDYTSVFEIHPKTQYMYFPRGGSIQVYDPIRNEQVFTQDAAPLLQMGKVRSEHKLVDPNVSLIAFNNDGEWMCTFDTIASSKIDNLLSKNDNQYALKFWKYVDNVQGKNPYWELSTKIIDPHGPENPILSIVPAPVSYHNGLAFITADSKGGLRLWRPRIPKEIYQKQSQQTSANSQSKLQQTAWTLRKSKPSGAFASNAVSVAWSQDGSLIILGHENSITALNTYSLEESSFQLPTLSGSRIRHLSIMGQYLVVLSKTRITTFDLLAEQLTPLAAKINTPLGGSNLIAIDTVGNKFCLAVNYYQENESKELTIKSKILIFKPNSLTPVYVSQHDQGISSIRTYRSGFILVDLDSRVGIVSSTDLDSSMDNEAETTTDLTKDMNGLLANAQAAADIIVNKMITVNSVQTKNEDMETMETEELTNEFKKVIDLGTFTPIFANVDGNEQIQSIFDSIIKSIS